MSFLLSLVIASAAASPSTVQPGVAQTYQQLAIGFKNTVCAIKTDGSIKCCGRQAEDALDRPPEGRFTALSVGFRHGCGLREDGAILCWGDNSCGQAEPPEGKFTQVSAGLYHSCGLRGDGRIACWGRDSNGEASAPKGAFVKIAAGRSFTCGIERGGAVRCWGVNEYGEANPPAGRFTDLATGLGYACGLGTDSHVTCWGAGGIYGRGADDPCWGAPEKNKAGQKDAFTKLSAGAGTTCGVRADGSVSCWGAGVIKRDGTKGEAISLPASGDFVDVAAGRLGGCALKRDGSLSCWGGCAKAFTVLGASPAPDPAVKRGATK